MNVELHPALLQVVQTAQLDPTKLAVAFMANAQKQVRVPDRHIISVSDHARVVSWNVPALRGLFRGNRVPPPDMDRYPEEYTACFFFVENQVLTVCDALGDLADQELEGIYAELRRRPDGRSLGAAHDLIWQIAALLLGSYPLCQAEFEALIGALVKSTRRWSVKPVSRFYVAYLRDTFGEGHSSSALPLK